MTNAVPEGRANLAQSLSKGRESWVASKNDSRPAWAASIPRAIAYVYTLVYAIFIEVRAHGNH